MYLLKKYRVLYLTVQSFQKVTLGLQIFKQYKEIPNPVCDCME